MVDPDRLSSASKDAFRLETGRRGLNIVGATPVAALYGVYEVAERLGVRFSLAGEVMPPAGAVGCNLDVSELAACLELPAEESPVFASRGLQPFHDFQSGPDAWDVDEYGRVAEMIVKGKGNFQGYHTYPLREPLVWVGLEDQFDKASGNVTWSYNTSWATNEETGWGYTPVPTSDYGFGADQIFPSDCFGNAINNEAPAICPFPKDAEENNEMFNRAGRLLGRAFRFAKSLGIRTTVGTEAPLDKPPQPGPGGPTTPLWLYWSSARGDSFATTTRCDECEGVYDFLGVVGQVWTSPPSPDALPLATWYNGEIDDNWLTTDKETAPAAGYGFVRVEGYALPPSSPLNSSLAAMQTWVSGDGHDHRAVASPEGAANASRAHYRESSTSAVVLAAPANMTPSSGLTTEDFYRGIFSRLQALEQPPDQYWVATPEGWEWSKVNMSNPLVQDAVQDMLAADAARKAVAPQMDMATYGWVLGPLGNRSYLDGVLPDDWTLTSIDKLVGWAPVDPAYANVTHHKKMVIPWAEDDPRLTAPELWVNRSISHGDDAEAYNADGLVNIHWRTRAVSPQVAATARRAWEGGFTSLEFWADWAAAEFGNATGPAAAALFEQVDSFSAPMPVQWKSGPGGLSADTTWCPKVTTNFTFVEPFCQLRPSVGADAARGLADAETLERFDYWCSAFRYWQLLAAVDCAWGQYNDVVAEVEKVKDPAQRVQQARQLAIPARAALVGNVSALMARQLETVSTVGERGITSNLRSHSLNRVVFDGTAALEELANLTSLPPACMPPTEYQGAPRFRVPSPRGILLSGDDLRVGAFALLPGGAAGGAATLFWRPFPSSAPFTAVPMALEAEGRAVWSAVVPSVTQDIEWYAQLKTGRGALMTSPPSGSARPYVTVTHSG